MKASGKRPTRRHKEIMTANGLSASEWLVVKNLDHQLIVIHRHTSEQKTLEI